MPTDRGRLTPHQAGFFPDPAKIDLTKPWQGVLPTPFDAARAAEIVVQCRAKTKHGPWVDALPEVMTPGENAYVHAVWLTIPDGSSNWVTAFGMILDGEDLPPTPPVTRESADAPPG